ncbi:MAG: citrate synthase, partial [bacterium]|nr:citrate synthase [bacterium]
AMILHAEHGGGNNSTFSVRTVSSSGANTYMAIASGIASLSGHLHGGANESVVMMMEKIKKNVKDWGSDRQIRSYINKLIQGKAGDRSGKVYGFGHAVYTLSDPRAAILKAHAEKFSKMKGSQDEFLLYDKVERIASEMLSERKNTPINSNVDYYSGFIYKLMGIPRELYTPIFAMARVVGWSAHRVEQIIQGKIIRPGYIPASVDELEYVKPENR